MSSTEIYELANQYFELISKRDKSLIYERYHDAANCNDKAIAIMEKLYALHPDGEDAVADFLDELERKTNDPS